jgi:hypothetical protein
VDLPVIQGLDVDAAHVAVYPYHRRQTSRQVQVRRAVFDSKGE